MRDWLPAAIVAVALLLAGANVVCGEEQIGRGVYGTRIERKADGKIDWDRTMGRKVDPPITIEVLPKIMSAGQTVRVRLRISRDSHNRTACFTYDGPEFSESCWDHLPYSPITHTRFVTLRRDGFYVLTGRLERNDGSRPAAALQVCVIGLNTEAADCFPGLAEQESTTPSVPR